MPYRIADHRTWVKGIIPFLFEMDGLLKDYPNIEFARYMDDIDIGVNSMATAKRVLRDLDLTLQSRHIRLNSGKTKILTSSEALLHFCVIENKILDALESRIKALILSGLSIDRQVKLLGWLMNRWDMSGRFAQGNGMKILKRLINYSKIYGHHIDSSLFFRYFINSPAMRETLLRYVSRLADPVVYIEVIDKAMASGQIIDDVSPIRIATALVTARYTKRLPAILINSLIDRFDKKSPFSLLAAIILVSRFQTYKEMRKIIDNSEYIWRTEPMIARAIAGFLSYFRGHRDLGPVSKRLSIVGGRAANEVLTFLDNVVFGADFSKIGSFLRAPNPSYVNGITHAKFGMIFGFLSNGNFSKSEKIKLLSKHPLMKADCYYGALIVAKLKAIP